MPELLDTLRTWASERLLNTGAQVQLGWVAFALVVGYLAARIPARRLAEWVESGQVPTWARPTVNALEDVLFPAVSLFLLLLYPPVGERLGFGSDIADAAVTLGLAWIVIRFVSALVRRPRMARMVAVLAFGVAALQLTGLLGHVLAALDALGVTLGGSRISLLTLFTGLVVVAVFLGLATLISGLVERRLARAAGLSPSMQVLFGKLIRITLVVFAFLLGLNAVGVDLSALTVFGGAVGVGLGFGLQKVVSNFISGIILLADRSIKPGDVIVVADTYGWVRSLSARYVSLITRDGKEHLIPNELLITERVENWTHTNTEVRVRIQAGISYYSDPRRAIELMLEAAAESSRVLTSPAPNCLLTGFGDSSVDLELRIWINDPAEGVGNVKSEVLLKIWDKFRDNGIEIPFPQRDVHIRTMPPQASGAPPAPEGA